MDRPLKERVSDILKENSPSLQAEEDDEWCHFISDEIVANIDKINTPLRLENLIGEHLVSISLSESQEVKTPSICTVIFQKLKEANLLPTEKNTQENDSSEEEAEQEGEEEEDGVFVQDGVCPMCEREMPLTKHHLIPREVHYWYKKTQQHDQRTAAHWIDDLPFVS